MKIICSATKGLDRNSETFQISYFLEGDELSGRRAVVWVAGMGSPTGDDYEEVPWEKMLEILPNPSVVAFTFPKGLWSWTWAPGHMGGLWEHSQPTSLVPPLTSSEA